ncbi:hypothetical protein PVAP13_8NG088402, partial [Panicum virgatum]
MVFSPLSTLQPKDWHKTIHVRVCRKWEYRGINEDNPLQHIDLVLVDSQGNTMYAEIPAKEADKHGPIIQVDRTYVISRFRVCNAKDAFRSVPGPYMLEFTCHTKISAATEEITEPKYIYNLTPFSKLPEFINDKKKFHDILGILTEINEPQWIPFLNQSKPSLRRDIKLKDEIGEEIKLVLWGSKATQFDIPKDTTSEDKPIIILFTGCLVKLYREPIAVLDLLTLREMEEIDPYEFPVMNPSNNKSWWYPACNFCRKSCQQDGSSYICLECNTIDKYSYKYKLQFIASDRTEESEMIAFATVAHRIVGKPVEAVMRSYRNRDNIPADIAAIVSSKFTFSVTMAEASYRNPKKSYQVNSIIHSYGKQRALPFHPPNQSQLNTPKSSSESPILDTPTKMLPLEQFSLQT